MREDCKGVPSEAALVEPSVAQPRESALGVVFLTGRRPLPFPYT